MLFLVTPGKMVPEVGGVDTMFPYKRNDYYENEFKRYKLSTMLLLCDQIEIIYLDNEDVTRRNLFDVSTSCRVQEQDIRETR